MPKSLAARLFLFVLLAAGLVAPQKAEAAWPPFEHFWQGTRDLATPTSAVLLGAGAAATAAAFQADKSVRSYFKRNEPMGEAAKVGNIAGNGLPTTLVSLGLFGAGHWLEKQWAFDMGASQLEGLLADFVITHSLKITVRRERPDGSSRTSFPSGHSSRSFSMAGNLWSLHGPWAGLAGVAFGSFVAASRMAVDKHYLSDTLAGATIGFITGYAYAIHHRAGQSGDTDSEPAAAMSVLPYYESSTLGVAVNLAL